MDKWEIEVQKAMLDGEKEAIDQIKQAYEQAKKDVNEKIASLQSQINQLQNSGNDDEATQSMIQSKVYQKQYQQAIKGQLDTILDNITSKNYDTISGYLQDSYEDGYIGTMYELNKQGLPIYAPIQQEQVAKAVVADTKLSQPLYESLNINTNTLKKTVRSEISRGIAQNMSYDDIARNISNSMNVDSNKAIRIARTEGHRIQEQAGFDSAFEAKSMGADIVKQWDATLDGRTRDSHAILDGEVRELDKPFSNGLMFPGDKNGTAGEVINCRCVMLKRARSALEEEQGKMTKWDGVNKQLLTIYEGKYQDFKQVYKEMIDKEETIDSIVNRMIERANKYESGITNDLSDVVGLTHGTIDYDVGGGHTSLDFRTKTYNSLKRKVTSDFTGSASFEDAPKTLDYINTHTYDTIRYTDLVDGDFYVSDYMTIKSNLEAKGYEIVRVKNTLNQHDVAYRGLNTVVRSPDGVEFELQFHTPDSVNIKEDVHQIYEESRKDTTTAEEKDRMNQQMIDMSNAIKDVPDIDAIQSYDSLKKGEQPKEVVVNAVPSDIRTAMTENGIVDKGLQVTTDKDAFLSATESAKESNVHGGSVDTHPVEELYGYTTILSTDGMAGVAVKPDGDIINVFKNSDDPTKGVVNDLIITARQNGGTKMDCYGSDLVHKYENCGYVPVAKIPFNPEYVTDPLLLEQRPDVYVMMKNTDDIQTVIEKNASGEYIKSTDADLDSLPVFTDYDEAMKYRDELLKKQGG